MEASDILELLRQQTGCAYLSQLHEPPFGMTLLRTLATFELEQYSLAAWESAIQYLTHRHQQFPSYADLAEYLSQET